MDIENIVHKLHESVIERDKHVKTTVTQVTKEFLKKYEENEGDDN